MWPHPDWEPRMYILMSQDRLELKTFEHFVKSILWVLPWQACKTSMNTTTTCLILKPENWSICNRFPGAVRKYAEYQLQNFRTSEPLVYLFAMPVNVNLWMSGRVLGPKKSFVSWNKKKKIKKNQLIFKCSNISTKYRRQLFVISWPYPFLLTQRSFTRIQNYLNMVLILSKIWLTRNTPTIPSIIWYSPRPGHSPRFDPKKLRESMKLNLSTEVFFTLTSSLNIKLNIT